VIRKPDNADEEYMNYF